MGSRMTLDLMCTACNVFEILRRDGLMMA